MVSPLGQPLKAKIIKAQLSFMPEAQHSGTLCHISLLLPAEQVCWQKVCWEGHHCIFPITNVLVLISHCICPNSKSVFVQISKCICLAKKAGQISLLAGAALSITRLDSSASFRLLPAVLCLISAQGAPSLTTHFTFQSYPPQKSISFRLLPAVLCLI